MPIVPFLAAWLLFGVIESVLPLFLPESRMVDVSRAITEAITEREAPDILVLGDSVAYGSIWSVELEDVLQHGVSAANFGIPGTNPITTYYLLRRQIENGKPPGVILYAHSPHTFVGDKSIAVQVGAFLNLAESWDLYWSGFDAFELLYGNLSRWSYTLRYRDSFRAMITRGEREFFVREERTVAFGQARMDRYLGDDDRFRQRNVAGLPQPPPRILFQPFEISQRKLEFVHKTIALAADNDIPIYWVSMPMPETTFSIRSDSGFMQRYYEQVDALVAGTAMEYLQREIDVLPDEQYRDYWHLQAVTGIGFSRHLGKLLQSKLKK
jgi:hypothetical protein